MKKSSIYWTSISAAVAMVILILDTRTAISGALAGLDLCVKSILPSLFPFCVLAKLINSSILGCSIPGLRWLGKMCGIPDGSESILVLSFLGGYPVGAQCIDDAFRNKFISHKDAQRMLGFCNNAGPAFLFGILGGLFESKVVLWGLLFIHITSAILVGMIIPGKSHKKCASFKAKSISLPAAIEASVRTMALVCGWVILFRVVMQFCDRWFLWSLDAVFASIFTGFLELSNGCISLYSLDSYGVRYVLSACLLSFGGVCVAMQTVSVTQRIGKTLYLPGKILQTCIAAFLAFITQPIFFSRDECLKVSIPGIFFSVSFVLLILFLLYRKKGWKSVKM